MSGGSIEREINRKSKAKFSSNLWEFVLNVKHTKLARFYVITRQVLIPHIFAILYSLILIFIQNNVNSICYLYPVCDCQNSPLIKFYTLVKCVLTYYSLLTVLAFYCFFIRIDLFRNKCIQISYLLIAVVIVAVPYMYYDGNSSQSPDVQIYMTAFLISLLFHFIALRKMHWNLKEFLKKSFPGNFILCIMFVQYMANLRWLPYMKSVFVEWSMNEGLNLYMAFLSLYSALYLSLFNWGIIKFGLLVKMEKYPNLNPIIFTSRICLCYAITIQISSLVSFNYYAWGQWILLIQYCFFLVQFFSRFDPIALFAKIMKVVCKIHIKIPQKSLIEIEIEKLFTGTMIDFILIFIPRLIILFTCKRWINYHLIEFYSNCQLEITNHRRFNMDFLIFIITITFMVALGTFLWMHKYKQTLLIGKTEQGNVFKQSYKIFLIHCLFELVFQDFQSAMH